MNLNSSSSQEQKKKENEKEKGFFFLYVCVLAKEQKDFFMFEYFKTLSSGFFDIKKLFRNRSFSPSLFSQKF